MRILLVSLVAVIFGLLLFLLSSGEEPDVSPSPEREEAPVEPPVGVPELPDDSAGEEEQGPAWVAGRVIDESGSPLADATVEITGLTLPFGEKRDLDRTETDPTGRFEFRRERQPREGEYLLLHAKKDGYAPVTCQLRSGRQDLEIRLLAGHPLAVTVTDKGSGEPLSGAVVRGWLKGTDYPRGMRLDLTGETDEHGSVRLEVPAGRVVVKAEKGGWSYAQDEIEVVPGRENTVQVALMPGVTLHGRVVEKGTDKGLEGVRVFYREHRGMTVTDEEGKFTAVFLPQYEGLFFSAPWHVSAYGNLRNVPLGTEVERVFELAPGGQVEGRVVDATGSPVEGAVVYAVNNRPPYYAEVRSDADGSFLLGGVSPGKKVIVAASRAGVAEDYSEPVSVVAGEVTAGVRISLPEGRTVVLVPITPDGSPPEGGMARVVPRDPRAIARPEGPPPPQRSARLEDGVFRLWGLVPGDCDVIVEVAGYAPVVLPLADVLPAAGEGERRVTVRLEEGLSISGTFVDGEGRPLSGAIVTARSKGPRSRTQSCRTGTDGGFEVKGLVEGDHEVIAKHLSRPPLIVRMPSVPAGTRDLLLAPESDCFLTGHVVDAEGRSFRGSARAIEEPKEERAPRDPRSPLSRRSTRWAFVDGDFRIDLTPGIWWIGFQSLDGAMSAPKRVDVKPGGNELPETRVTGLRGIAGVVRGPGGAVANGSVSLSPAEAPAGDWPGQGLYGSTRVDIGPDGSFAIGPLEPGRWRLEARAPGHLARVVDLEVPEGAGAFRQEITLVPGAYLAVRFFDPAGNSLRGSASLSSVDGSSVPRPTISQEMARSRPGHWVYGPYAEGTYRLTAHASAKHTDPPHVSLAREMEVGLRMGETTELTIRFTQEEFDLAVKKALERREQRKR